MESLDNKNERYVSLAKVAEKFPNLAKKLDTISSKFTSPEVRRHNIEGRLIRLAIQGNLNLYCFKLIHPRLEKQWFIIQGDGLRDLLGHSPSLDCTPFLDNQRDSNSDTINWKAQPDVKVEVSRYDLYFDREELAQMEKDDPELSGEEIRAETNTSKLEEPGIASQSDASKKSYVPLAETANKWSCEEDDLIYLAIWKEFNLYYLKPLPTQSGFMTTTPHYIGDELNNFLPRKTSISCSRFLVKDCNPIRLPSKIMSSEEHKVVDLNPMDSLDPVVHDMSNLNLPPPGHVIVYRTDLYLDQDEINRMEEEYPVLIKEEVKIETDSQPEDINTPSQSDTSKAESEIATNVDPIDPLLNNDDSQ